MRLKNLAPTILAALATVFVLAACGQSAGDQQSSQGNQEGQEQAQKQDTPEQKTPDKQVAPKQAPKESGEQVAAVEPPSDDMMKLTIPKMERIENDEVPTGPGTDTAPSTPTWSARSSR